jgi:hypothetical protein
MNKIPPMAFHYAIKRLQGIEAEYYLGPSVVDKKGTRKDNPANFGPKHQAYTYTEKGAYAAIDRNRTAFAGCSVERVL